MPSKRVVIICFIYYNTFDMREMVRRSRDAQEAAVSACAGVNPFTLHAVPYTLHTTHYTLHTAHYTIHTTHYTIPTPHSTLLTTLHTTQDRERLHILESCTVTWTQQTRILPAPCILHPKPQTLNPEP